MLMRVHKAILAAEGWLPFDQFMALALYEPGLGYYANQQPKFGTMPQSGSDFVTAPELSPLFGAALAKQVAEALAKPVDSAVQAVLACVTGGGKVLTAGMGASWAMAQYLALLLVGGFERGRPGLAAMALGLASLSSHRVKVESLFIDEGKPLPGAIETTVRNLREIAPTVYFNVPTGFEAIANAMKADDALRRRFGPPPNERNAVDVAPGTTATVAGRPPAAVSPVRPAPKPYSGPIGNVRKLTPEEIAALSRNQHRAAEHGREPNLMLERGDKEIALRDWGLEIMQELHPIAVCRIQEVRVVCGRFAAIRDRKSVV